MADLEILMQRFVEGTLDANGSEELLQLLKADPAKRHLLALHVVLDEELKQHDFPQREPRRLVSDPVSETSLPAPFVMNETEEKLLAESPDTNILAEHQKVPPKSVPRQPEMALLIPFIAVALIALIVWSAYLSLLPEQEVSKLEIAEIPQMPAVMVDFADVKWVGNAPKLGEPLMPGSLAFESGTIEMLFFNGVRSVIEGPADLLLVNDSQVFCRRGKWSVTVPPSGIGFEIQTPHGTIRDLGTQFFAAVAGEQCDVHVLKGSVELKDTVGKKTVFKADQAVGFRAGIWTPQQAEPEYFVTKTEMRQRSDDDFKRNPPPVVPKKEPILSVDFSQKALPEGPQGVILFSGRREDSAFHFTDRESRIRLQPLGRLSSFTALIDIRVDRLGAINNPILMSEGSNLNGLIWSILPNGSLILGRRTGTSKTYITPIVFTEESLGEWTQLGLSYDGARSRMCVFWNGDLIYTTKLPESGAMNLNALDAGNWKVKGNIGQLNGAIRNIVLFNRVLEYHEMREPTVVPSAPH